jgi:hypothetical protein
MLSQRNLLLFWFPLCVTLATLIGSAAVPDNWAYRSLAKALGFGFVVGMSYFLILLVLRLFQKKWKSALAAFLCLSVSLSAIVPVAMFAFANAFFGPSEDGFADNLEVPAGVTVSDPLEWPPESRDSVDEFQDAVLNALQMPGDGGETFTANLGSLVHVRNKAPAVLERYLASHPGWRVFRENGKRFATRRWAIESAWRYSLHGYYTDFDIRNWPPGTDPEKFQSRFTLGLDGQPWARIGSGTTTIQLGDTVTPVLSSTNGNVESHIVIEAGDLVVEVFEQSSDHERRMTNAALEFLDAEMQALRDIDGGTGVDMVLDDSFVRRGQPSIELYKSFQPGIYDSYVWANPGEPGMTYLKAFEITREYQLSSTRLPERSNEWIGWSDDPDELFLSNTQFTIYEGDWGQPYAARFEVWFVPDSGAPERKLIQRNFKIEGWMR